MDQLDYLIYGYLRKSRDEESGPNADVDILAKHRALMQRTMAHDGVCLLPGNSYEEIGSAETIDQRPAFLALLAAWERLPDRAGGVVYVTELSRLSRGLLLEQGRVEDVLMRKGIRIRTPGRYYDLHNYEDRLSFHFEGLISNAEYELIKRRFAAGKRELLLQGRVRTGHVPFGYSWVIASKGDPVVVPEEFAILKLMCADARHMSPREIGAKYGISAGYVRKILTNPVICGYPAQRFEHIPGAKRGHCRQLPLDQWTWPKKPGNYPAACTREEWDAIQVALKLRERGRVMRGEGEDWCRDLVTFTGAEGRLKLGRVSGALTYDLTVSGRPMLYVPREQVHTAAEATLRGLLCRPELIRDSLSRYTERRGEKRSYANADADALTADLERLRRMDERALTRELQTDDPEEVSRLAEVRGNIRRDLTRVKAALGVIQQQQHSIAEIDGALPYIAQVQEDFAAAWELAPNSIRRVLARAFLASIEVTVRKIPGQPTYQREVTRVTVRNSWLEEGLT